MNTAIALLIASLGFLVLMSFGPIGQSAWKFIIGLAGTVGTSIAGLIIDQTHTLMPIFVLVLWCVISISITVALQRPEIEIEITETPK